MPRGQYDREAARAKRQAERSNGKVKSVTLGLVDYLQEHFDLEFTAEDVVALHETVQEALAE